MHFYVIIGGVRPEKSLFFDIARKKRQSPSSRQSIFFEDLIFTEEQQIICSNNSECLFDLAVTGSADIALTTLNQQQEANRTMDLLSELLIV